MKLVPIASVAPEAVERLLDQAFEPGRHLRTAYAVRRGTLPIPELSLAALDNDALVGAIQCWPVVLDGDDGSVTPLVMVGPVAVDPARQGGGVGALLMTSALAAARSHDLDRSMTLIGDPEYYGRFGFRAERTAGWRVPGPIEQRRLLARGSDVPMVTGLLGPRITVAA